MRGGTTFVGRTLGGKDADYKPFTEEAEKFVKACRQDNFGEASEHVERLRSSKEFCSCPGRSRKRVRRGKKKKKTFCDEDVGKKPTPLWAGINAHLLKGRCRTCGRTILLTAKEALLKERLKASRIDRGSSEERNLNSDLRKKMAISPQTTRTSSLGKNETIFDLLNEFASDDDDEEEVSVPTRIFLPNDDDDTDPGEPNYIIYLDVSSLYASSGKTTTSFFSISLHIVSPRHQKLRTIVRNFFFKKLKKGFRRVCSVSLLFFYRSIGRSAWVPPQALIRARVFSTGDLAGRRGTEALKKGRGKHPEPISFSSYSRIERTWIPTTGALFVCLSV